MSVLQHYDKYCGWENTKPGWYEANAKINFELEKYFEIINWLAEHIDGYEKHCRWIHQGNTIDVRFRYERDYIWFNLTWS